MKKLFKTVALILLATPLFSCGKNSSPDPVNIPTEIVLSESSFVITMGNTALISARVLPSSASQDLTYTINEGTDIVSVSGVGLITPLKEGEASIRVAAKVKTDVYKDVSVKVNDPNSPQMINIGSTDVYVAMGSSLQLYPQIIPSGASQAVIYTVDGETITISDSGTITPIKVGVSTVRISSQVKPSLYKDVKVTVYDSGKKPTSLTILPDEDLLVGEGNDLQLSISALPEGSANAVTWTLESGGYYYPEAKDYAEINASGLLHAKKAGYVNVKAVSKLDAGVSVTKLVTITQNSASGIKLTRDHTFNLEVGDERELSASLYPTYTVGDSVDVSISNPGIVSYDETTTKFTCLAEGNTTFTFSSHNKPSIKKSVDVVVSKKTPLPTETYDESIYGTYYKYNNEYLSWSNSEDLLNKLRSICQVKNKLKYDWVINPVADQSLYDETQVYQLYSDVSNAKDHTLAESNWQREHVFAASLMTGKATGEATKTPGMATDYHNLFASFNSANSSRGNNNLGYADSSQTKTVGNVKYNFINQVEGDPTYEANYEPADTDKGRTARALFYMEMMYGTKDTGDLKIVEPYVTYSSTEVDDEGNPINPHSHGNLSDLLDWNEYSVDRMEYQHNEAVYKTEVSSGVAQGNRNPFVDYPELVEYCFGDLQDCSGELKNLKPSKLELKGHETVHVNYSITASTVREYVVNSELSSNDLHAIEVMSDLSRTSADVSHFTYTGKFTDGYRFTANDVGTQIITLECDAPEFGKTNNQTIEYTIKVVEGKIEDSTYWTHFVPKTATDLGPNDTKVTVSSDKSSVEYAWQPTGLDWKVSMGIDSNISITKSTIGIKYGSGTNPIKSLTFETVSDFTFDDKNKVNYVWVNAGSASGKEYDLKITVGSTTIYNDKIKYSTSTFNDYQAKCNNLTGKVKIEITNVTAGALYLQYIAINAIN